MSAVMVWLKSEWLAILVPVIIFWMALFLTFWLRKSIRDYAQRHLAPGVWQANARIVDAFQSASALWCLFISLYLALLISSLPAAWKFFLSRTMWTLLLISLVAPLVRIVNNLILSSGQKLNMEKGAVTLSLNICRSCILFLGVLLGLEIWEVPTNLIYIILGVGILVGALAFRDNFPNFFAGIQIGAAKHIKAGDYIKLEGGQEGYISKIGWNNTLLRTIETNTVIVPNNYLLQHTIINYGRPLRKANEPFQFNSLKMIKQPTGLKAKDLRELSDLLHTVPDDVIYCHIFRYLEDNPYQIFESNSDFIVWVRDVLKYHTLAARMSEIHLRGFTDLNSLRKSLIVLTENFLTTSPPSAVAPKGKEFYFVKGIPSIHPTRYAVNDLREFVEVVRRIDMDPIYYHFLESRLRLGNGMDDFSIWFTDSLNEPELGEEVNQINPYAYTPESLRSELIKSIERRIK